MKARKKMSRTRGNGYDSAKVISTFSNFILPHIRGFCKEEV